MNYYSFLLPVTTKQVGTESGRCTKCLCFHCSPFNRTSFTYLQSFQIYFISTGGFVIFRHFEIVGLQFVNRKFFCENLLFLNTNYIPVRWIYLKLSKTEWFLFISKTIPGGHNLQIQLNYLHWARWTHSVHFPPLYTFSKSPKMKLTKSAHLSPVSVKIMFVYFCLF